MMKNELPQITLPAEPLSESWAETVELLIDRAWVVEQWANQLKQRAEVALGAHDAVIVALCNALESGDYLAAKKAAQDARDVIQERRKKSRPTPWMN